LAPSGLTQGSTAWGVNRRQCSPAFGHALGIPSLPLLKWTVSSLPGSRERSPRPNTPHRIDPPAQSINPWDACRQGSDPEVQTTRKPSSNKGLRSPSPRAHPADSGFDALRDCGARQVCHLRFVSSRLRAGSGNLRKREKLNSPPITRFPEFSRRAEKTDAGLTGRSGCTNVTLR
jgi:hypothetical protein